MGLAALRTATGLAGRARLPISGEAATAQFTDNEIEYELTVQSGDETRTAIALFKILANRFAGAADVSSGSQRINMTKVSAGYAARAAALEAELDEAEGAGADALTDVAIVPVDGYSDDVATNEVDRYPDDGWDPYCGGCVE